MPLLSGAYGYHDMEKLLNLPSRLGAVLYTGTSQPFIFTCSREYFYRPENICQRLAHQVNFMLWYSYRLFPPLHTLDLCPCLKMPQTEGSPADDCGYVTVSVSNVISGSLVCQ